MKRVLSVLFLLNIFIANAQTSRYDVFGYPTYEDAVDYVSEMLTLKGIEYYEKYRLAKKPDGWYVYITRYDSTTTKSYKKFWSKPDDKYLRIGKIKPADEVAEVKKKLMIDKHNDVMFCPFYGYVGYSDEIISTYKDSANLPDAYLQGLARAYQNKAMHMLYPNAEFAQPYEHFDLEVKENSLTSLQLEKIKAYSDTSLGYYMKLMKQNPKFETVVGNIQTKYSNEVMTHFLYVAQFQNLNAAIETIREKDLYSPFIIAFAKNLLNSCQPNGIIYTNADNDTYPLYYVQARYGYRTDVLVVNYSFTYRNRYMSMLKRGLFSAPPIPSTLNFDTYPDDSLSYVLRREEMFGKLSKSDGFKLNEDLKGILKTEAYLLDVIRASNGKRPIHFASTFNLKDLFGLEKYLKQDYLVFTLTRRYNNDYAASYVTIDTKAAYDNFLKAEFIDWRTQPFIDDITPRICVSYVYGGCRLASALYNEGKKKECTLVLDRLVSSFPDTIQPFNVNLFQAPALYAKCGQVDKGLAIAEVLIKNGKERYSRSVNNTTVAYSEWDTEMRSALYVIQEVLPFYKEYAADKPELTEAHQQAFNEMVEVYQRKLKDKNIKND